MPRPGDGGRPFRGRAGNPGILGSFDRSTRCAVSTSFLQSLAEQTEALKAEGLFKAERLIDGPQQADIDVRANGGTDHVLNLCANNYLGLANHPEVVAAAHEALDQLRLRRRVGALHLRHADDPQGPGGAHQRVPRHRGHDPLPELLRRQRRPVRDASGPEDAIISDALNHASIIDGMRLCKAALFATHDDMAEPRGAAAGPADAAQPADRHRRRVLDGRHDRRPRGHLRAGRVSTTRW
jgi:hypothetical protein